MEWTCHTFIIAEGGVSFSLQPGLYLWGSGRTHLTSMSPILFHVIVFVKVASYNHIHEIKHWCVSWCVSNSMLSVMISFRENFECNRKNTVCETSIVYWVYKQNPMEAQFIIIHVYIGFIAKKHMSVQCIWLRYVFHVEVFVNSHSRNRTLADPSH